MEKDNGLVNTPDEKSEYPRNWKNPDGQYLVLEAKVRGDQPHVVDDMVLRELVILGFRLTRNEYSNALRLGILGDRLDTDSGYRKFIKRWTQTERFFGYGLKDTDVDEKFMKIEVREIGSEALRSMAIEMVTPDGKKAGVNINIWDVGKICISKLAGVVDFSRTSKNRKERSISETDIVESLKNEIINHLKDIVEDDILADLLVVYDGEADKLLKRYWQQETHFTVNAVKYKG